MRYDIETTLVIVMNVLFIEMLSAVLLIEFTVETLMQMCAETLEYSNYVCITKNIETTFLYVTTFERFILSWPYNIIYLNWLLYNVVICISFTVCWSVCLSLALSLSMSVSHSD